LQNSVDSKVSVLINFGTIKNTTEAEVVLDKAKQYGKIIKARMYVEQEEMDLNREVITEISKLGIEPVITILAKNVRLAIDLLDDAYDENVDIIVIIHDREDIIPALMQAKTLKQLVLIVPTKAPKSFHTVTDEVVEI